MLLTIGLISSFLGFVLLAWLPAVWSEPWMREPLFTDKRTRR